ncbi:unnamed protein product [Arctogadus glacialis]
MDRSEVPKLLQAQTLAGLKRVFEQAHLFVDSAPRARRNLREALLPVTSRGGFRGGFGDGDDPCSLILQTQANQTRLQHRGAPRMPFVAVALGLMGISMSGYSSCQLTLHYRPANHLFKGAGRTAAHLQNAHTNSPLV